MSDKLIIPDEAVINKIDLLREQKVMLDSNLVELFGVENRVLNKQIEINELRFSEDFMFQLTEEEWENLKSQS